MMPVRLKRNEPSLGVRSFRDYARSCQRLDFDPVVVEIKSSDPCIHATPRVAVDREAFECKVALYPGRYRVRASFWSLQWDKGQILPSRGTEAARLNLVHLQEKGRHEGHPSELLGYFDAPSLKPQVHELDVWLNFKDCFGFNPASLVPVDLYRDGA
jgi:hypothetical protein